MEKAVDVKTKEEWEEMIEVPYARDFDNGYYSLEGSVVRSREDLSLIYGLSNYSKIEWNWHQYCPTRLPTLEQLIFDLLMQTDKRPDARFCDLGIGTGQVQAVFAALGFRSYGVDISAKALDHSQPYYERVQAELGRFRHSPVVERCDVLSEEFSSFTFTDGTRMEDMDILFCHIGDYPATWVDIMKRLPNMKNGSVWLNYFIMFIRPKDFPHTIMDTPFRPIHPNCYHSLLMAK